MKRISVIIPTYNRADNLPAVLRSVVAQTLSPREYEVIVVDNASTDATCEAVARFTAEYPHIRYIYEPTQGVSHARNRGLQEANTPYVAFLDDDACADQDWLPQLLGGFADNSPRPQVVVGKVLLDWQTDRPDWFPSQYETIVGAYSPQDSNFYLKPGDYFLTMNVALDRQILLESGGFDVRLGPQGSRHIVGDDSELAHRLLSKGYTAYYESRAVVYHLVSGARQTRRYLLARLFWQGATQPLLDAINSNHVNRKGNLRRVIYDVRLAIRYFATICLEWIRSPHTVPKTLFLFAQQIGRVYSELRLLAHPLRR